MTSTYHTPIVNGQTGDQTTFNTPLGQLDQEIGEILTGVEYFILLNTYGNVNVGANLDVTGATTVHGALSTATTLLVGTNATVSGKLTVVDGLAVASSASGNVIADSTLTGTTTTSNVNVTGDLDVSNISSTKLLVLDTVTTATITGGAITVTSSRMTIDTESAASTDDLVSIAGGTSGKVLLLQITSSARVIVIKHGTGANQIYTRAGFDFTLSTIGQLLMLVFNGTSWTEVAGNTVAGGISVKNQGDASTTSTDTLVFPFSSTTASGSTRTINLAPDPGFKTVVWINPDPSSSPAYGKVGTGNINTNGNHLFVGTLDSVYTRVQHGATANNQQCYVGTYPLWRADLNAITRGRLRLPGSLANQRMFWGFMVTGSITNSDTLAVAFAGFRVSAVAGDTNIKAITSTGAAQTVTDTGVLAVADGTVDFVVVTSSSSVLFFLGGNLVATHTTTLPGSTLMNAHMTCWTTAIAQNTFHFGRLMTWQD